MAAPRDKVEEPFPIFKLAHRFLLYDVDTITHIRAKYNISGVLIGGLPQAPQQNVFLGIPLELMPEEARSLCEKGVAYVQDDVHAHKQGFLNNGMSTEERQAYQAALRKQGQAAAEKVKEKADDKKKTALSKKLGVGDWNDIPEDMLTPTGSRPSSRASKRKGRSGAVTPLTMEPQQPQSNGAPSTKPPALNNSSRSIDGGGGGGGDDEELLFSSSTTPSQPQQNGQPPSSIASNLPAHYVTPTTSYPPLQSTPPPNPPSRSPITNDSLPSVPPSYPLYKHLHEQDYFLAPGLRFGCQYMAYPGDPLRFHSHFLCNGMDWDQEFDLLGLVGGGRLGTGVKKGFLIGGEEPRSSSSEEPVAQDEISGGVRAFCLEWGGM